MTSDTPDDAPRTVVIPNPGGRARPAEAMAGMAAGGGDASSAYGLGEAGVGRPGVNPLVDAAAPVFELIIYLSRQIDPIPLDDLRQKIHVLIRQFVDAALAAGESRQTVGFARYALCATLDDVIMSRPWSPEIVMEWGAETLISKLANEVVGGDNFFRLLEKIQQDPLRWRNLIELKYICLSLGFQGRYRRDPHGREELERIRKRAWQAVVDARQGLTDRLSINWKGAEIGRARVRDLIPVWLVAAVSLGVVALLFAGAWKMVGGTAAAASNAVAAMPISAEAPMVHYTRPEPEIVVLPPAEPERIEEVSRFLQPEIDEGLVQVYEEGDRLKIRIVTEVAGKSMFASAKAHVQDAYLGVIERIAVALNDQPGKIVVEGHSDSIPLRNSRKYASNYELSLARAEAVMKVLARYVDPLRMTAEGRDANEPIATNTTREGRALNRRVEIALIRQ